MSIQTPITLVTGPLGSGKTTLVQHILRHTSRRLALIVNEFGELNIDGKVLEGENVQLTELAGGCVCCSLLGEFEAAVEEILETVKPEAIVVEATGVAEPEALVLDAADALPGTRFDGVVTVMDADAMISFPELGHTSRMQIAAADLILLNKADLVGDGWLSPLEDKLREYNEAAPILPTCHGQVDLELLFGISADYPPHAIEHTHVPDYQSFTYRSKHVLRRECFEQAVQTLAPGVYRAKGFVRLVDGTYLFNYVNERWGFDPYICGDSALVFIGRDIETQRAQILESFRVCEE